MKINDRRFMPIEPVQKTRGPVGSPELGKKDAPDFAQLLKKEMEKERPVKMSAHAQMRLKQRDISLTGDDMQRIENAFDALEQKGSRNSVLFYKESAFVASVDNRTVITAMDLEEDLQVITNIDSAAYVK